ncbi:MAG: type IV pilus biogenesis/stability protein PilW [Methylomonas sp.]
MAPKRMGKTGIILLAAALSSACTLLPDFSGDSMSNAEKANLNMLMGTRYLEMGMLDVAKEKLELALDLDSGNADIHNAMGIFYERIKEYDKAADQYESAVSKGPDSFDIKSNYGRFLCDRGDFKKGMAVLQQALDAPMNNRQWFALTNMGICYVEQNDLSHAEDYLRQALQLQADYPPALLEMQKISYENRQYMSARAFLERYLAVGKHTPETLWIAYQTERSLGNQKTAEEYGQQLTSLFPVSKEAQQIKNAIGK